MDWFSICSNGVVISCIVACSSVVDRPSTSSVHLILRLRTFITFCGNILELSIIKREPWWFFSYDIHNFPNQI